MAISSLIFDSMETGKHSWEGSNALALVDDALSLLQYASTLTESREDELEEAGGVTDRVAGDTQLPAA